MMQPIVKSYPINKPTIATTIVSRCLISVILAVPLTFIIQDVMENRTAFSIIMLCIFILSFGYFYYFTYQWIRTTRLDIYADHIEYHSYGFVISTSWDNIDKIDKQTINDTLYLYKPSIIYISTIIKILMYTSMDNKNIDRRIPLSMFGLSTKHGEFCTYLQNYAPNTPTR